MQYCCMGYTSTKSPSERNYDAQSITEPQFVRRYTLMWCYILRHIYRKKQNAMHDTIKETKIKKNSRK